MDGARVWDDFRKLVCPERPLCSYFQLSDGRSAVDAAAMSRGIVSSFVRSLYTDLGQGLRGEPGIRERVMPKIGRFEMLTLTPP
jgi:hypothetical protein